MVNDKTFLIGIGLCVTYTLVAGVWPIVNYELGRGVYGVYNFPRKYYLNLVDPNTREEFLLPWQIQRYEDLETAARIMNKAQKNFLDEVMLGRYGNTPDFVPSLPIFQPYNPLGYPVYSTPFYNPNLKVWKAGYGPEPIYDDPLYEWYLFVEKANYPKCDDPLKWQMYLHDPASISMEGFLSFNNHLLFTIIAIVVFAGWLLYYTLLHFEEYNNSYNSKFVHYQELEIVWTSVPALILLVLAGPSFTLLYSMDEVSGPYSFFEGFRPPVVLGL